MFYLNHKAMNKKLILCLVSLLTVSVCFAQDYDYIWRNRYVNFGYANSTMHQDQGPDLKTYGGASFTIGRTYYLHSSIWGFFRFGIDATWLDLNYTSYRIKHITDYATNKYKYHQGEISVQIGPSLTIRPFGDLNIHGFFRYAPAYSVLYADNTLYGGYATFFVGGGSISYGAIGLGFESRFGTSDYNDILIGDAAATGKLGHKGWRAYLTFRF